MTLDVHKPVYMVQLQVITYVFSVLSFSLTIMFHILPSYIIAIKGICPEPHYKTSNAEKICGLRYRQFNTEKEKKKKGGGQGGNKERKTERKKKNKKSK